MEKTEECRREIIIDKKGRLDVSVAEKLAISRTAAQKLIIAGQVHKISATGLVKEQKAAGMATPGEIYCVQLEPLRAISLAREDKPLEILYEDNDFLVLNKPAGMLVHPTVRQAQGTLVNALLFHIDNLSGIGGEIRPGIVHRLDKDTSGVMVIAKNDYAHQNLSEQFASRSIKKTYLALVGGVMEQRHGKIQAALGRHRTIRTKMSVVAKKGREAITEYELIRQYHDCALLRVFPRTGRTHQIRVHFGYIKHPVVGDIVYGSKKSFSGVSRHLLHAESITFTHPRTGSVMTFSAPLPEDFKKVVDFYDQMA